MGQADPESPGYLVPRFANIAKDYRRRSIGWGSILQVKDRKGKYFMN